MFYRYSFSMSRLQAIATAAVLCYLPPAQAQDVSSFLRDGYAALQKGSYLQAESTLRKAVKLDPRNAAARRYLSVAMVATGDASNAMTQVYAAQSIDGVQANDWILLGNAHFALSETEEARKAYISGLKNPSTHVSAALGLIRIHIAQGQLHEAAQLCSALNAKRLSAAEQVLVRRLSYQVEQAKISTTDILNKG